MKSTFHQLNSEVSQAHALRRPYLQKIQRLRGGKTVVSFFVSFTLDTMLSQQDADMIQEVLANTDTSKGISLILDAPGGDGLAAERIIQICRAYCLPTKAEFETIVPARSKSAATMVCLGSDRILMSATSELGPIDPQVPLRGDNGRVFDWVPAYHYIKTYDDLMKAANTTKNNIEPYLQQLSKFSAIQISNMRAGLKLSENIAVLSLQAGMMKGQTEAKIKSLIKPFLDPNLTFSHGRALNYDQCSQCGLNIELVDLRSELYQTVWGLYQRSFPVVNSVPKLIETVDSAYTFGERP